MALFRSERGIGRGEVAESRIEAPFFAAFMVFCALGLFLFHSYVRSPQLTIALGVSMIVFGVTVVRVELGVYILVIAMLFSPEIQGEVVGHSARVTQIRYDDILVVVIFAGVLIKCAFERRRSLWRPSPINAGIAAYYGLCLLSTVMALRYSLPAWDRHAAFFVLMKMAEFYMIFFLIGSAVRTTRDVHRQLRMFIIVALVLCGYCAMQIGGSERMSAPFDAGGTEPNTLGGYLVIVMCIAGGLLAHAPNMKRKVLCLGLFTAAFVPFLFTLSRASYVAFLVSPIVLAILSKRYHYIVFVLILIVFYESLMPTEVQDRVNYTFQKGTGERIVIAGRDTGLQVDKSTYERIYVWGKVRYTLSIWPWFGAGVAWLTVLDSQYARVLIETGLLGFAAFLFLQYRLLRTTREAYKWSRDWVSKGLALGTCTATVALMVHSIGTISFLIVRIMEPYWFLVALTVVVRANAIEDYRALAIARRAKAAEAPATEPIPAPAPASSSAPQTT